MGRPLGFNKEQALEKALQVFWRKGYETTSLQDLIETMDLSKSSFYQTFTSKQNLFVKCLENYQSSLAADLAANLERAASARTFIEQTFVELVGTSNIEAGQNGCFLMNSPNEFPFGHEQLSPVIAAGFRKLETVWETAVKRAQIEGDIAPEKDAPALANYLILSISGLRTMIKAGTNPKMLNKMVENILLAILLQK